MNFITLRLPFLLFMATLFSACSFHMGTMSGGTGVITTNNFKSIDFAYGRATTTHILGIGGNDKDALVLEAKRNLYQNYNLQPGQVIGQTTVDFKRTFYPFVMVTKAIVSAEIIDFADNQLDTTLYRENLENFRSTSKRGLNVFQLGDEVLYVRGSSKPSVKASVIGRAGDRYVIEFLNDYNYIKTTTVSFLKLKKISAPKKGDGSPTMNQTLDDTTPRDENNPSALFTPLNPVNRLIKFKYNGKQYIGEFVRVENKFYIIKMQRGSGKMVGIQVPKRNILDENYTE